METLPLLLILLVPELLLVKALLLVWLLVELFSLPRLRRLLDSDEDEDVAVALVKTLFDGRDKPSAKLGGSCLFRVIEESSVLLLRRNFGRSTAKEDAGMNRDGTDHLETPAVLVVALIGVHDAGL